MLSGSLHAEDIVGRERELAALRAWLDGASAGTGRLVLCVGEPGIGKTRIAQELAGIALARGIAVAWGRCVETEGAPAFWPWRQVLRSLDADSEAVFAGDVERPEDRFRLFDDVTETVRAAAGTRGLVVILDDLHWADEPSLLVLRHLAEQIADGRLLVFAAFRDVEPASVLPRVLPELARSPSAERLDLRNFGLDEVREQLSRATASDSAADARTVLEVTGGNPLFVREIARAIADGTWRPDRPPHTVLDVVRARLERVSAGCRRLVQAAAIVGRDFSLTLVAETLAKPVDRCLPLVDEAVANGLIDQVGDAGEYRFVHALTRDAVEASLASGDRVGLHRAVAEAIESQFAGDLSEHLGDLARHWAKLAPYGEAATARRWTTAAADDAVRRLAYEEGVRLYRAALSLDHAATPVERVRLLTSLGRAAYFAGDLDGWVEAAVAGADTARAIANSELLSDAALVLEATADSGVNAIAKQLCEEALAELGDSGHEAARARLLAQRSHLAYYDGVQRHVESMSGAALDLAHQSGDDRALVDALHARKEACPGPAGRVERLRLATEMLALAPRTNSARTAMWGELWRIDALAESGQLTAAAEELSALEVAVERVGGPVTAWHLDRVRACIAQAQARYAVARAAGRRAFERMREVEPRPATGAYFSLQCALACHIGVTDEVAEFVEHEFDPLPRFTTMGPLTRAVMLLRAGLPDRAAASYQQAGPLATWSMPAFFVLLGHVYAALAAAELGRHDDLVALLERLTPYRGEHAFAEGVAYLGPIELALGRGAAAIDRLDDAIDDLAIAVDQAERAGAPGFAAEARYHLAAALVARGGDGDRGRAEPLARDADRMARVLGMAAFVDRTGALVAELEGRRHPGLSPRESEVAQLVAEGLTNRQIAERLFISERTAQNHVQHILNKLGFTARSQIASWSARESR